MFSRSSDGGAALMSVDDLSEKYDLAAVICIVLRHAVQHECDRAITFRRILLEVFVVHRCDFSAEPFMTLRHRLDRGRPLLRRNPSRQGPVFALERLGLSTFDAPEGDV